MVVSKGKTKFEFYMASLLTITTLATYLGRGKALKKKNFLLGAVINFSLWL